MDSLDYINPLVPCGLNLYAYCENNPVMLTDGTGQSPDQFANNFVKNVLISHSMVNTPWASSLLGNVSYTMTHNSKKPSFLHTFSIGNLYDNIIGFGAGTNIFGILGTELYVAADGWYNAQLGIAFSFGRLVYDSSLGANGIRVGIGWTTGNTTEMWSASLGWGGALALATAPIWAPAVKAAVAPLALIALSAVIVGDILGIDALENSSMLKFFRSLKFW
jgi:hypothetical protein